MKGIGKESGGLYHLPATLQCEETKGKSVVMMTQSSNADQLLWHSRLGHPSMKVMKHLFMDRHLSVSSDCSKCSICPLAKQTRLPFPLSMSRALGVFDLIHLDVWGPYKTPTHNDFRFFLTIVDDHSRVCWVYLLRLKSEVFPILRSFLMLIRTQFNKHVKRLRTDNGSEFFSTECCDLLKALGVIPESSCPYTPQQNGVVKRKHRHILEVARAVRFQANLPIRFWGECVLSAAYLINRLPTPVLKGKSPYEHVMTLSSVQYFF